MIQNKLKEAYPTPLQLRNATKELQHNMEISNEVYIDINWDLTQDYTSPDKSIVYTASNKTITFNMDIGFKLNCLNYIFIVISEEIKETAYRLIFYSANNSYNFICMYKPNTAASLISFKLEQKDENSWYEYNDNKQSFVLTMSNGYIEFDIEYTTVIIIKNIVLGKIIDPVSADKGFKVNYNHIIYNTVTAEI